MRNRLKAIVIVLGFFICGAGLPASAQSMLQGVTSCSQAYGKCFDYCASQFPGGGVSSARCVDQCTYARAKCDRNGCFNTKTASSCGLSKR